MHPSLRQLTSREVERVLLKAGFRMARQAGSHQQFVGFIKGEKRRVTVIADKKSFKLSTLKAMIRQSGLSEAEWLTTLK